MAPERTGVTPRVTVGIPTRDRPGTLRIALDSVLAQTRQDFELLVVDDSTGQETATLLASYHDPRVRHVRGAGGMAAAFNRCVELARGAVVAILHDDDAWHPDFLRVMVGHLERDGELGMAFCAASIIDPDGRAVDIQRSWTTARRFAPGEAFADLVTLNRILAPTVVVRRDAYQAVGPYDAGIEFALDWDMWLRIAARFACLNEPRVLASYRKGHGSLTDRLSTPRGAYLLNEEAVRIVRNAARSTRDSSIPGSRSAIRRALAERWTILAMSSVREGRFARAAGQAFRGAIQSRAAAALPLAALGLVAMHALSRPLGPGVQRRAAAFEERARQWRRRRLA